MNLCCFPWHFPLLTSERVTHKEIKTSQNQVLVSVKCRRKAGGKQPGWQNSRVSALCRELSQQPLARSRALSPALRGPQLRFLPVIDLANHHSVALWHSSCKLGLFSLQPGSWHSPQTAPGLGDRAPKAPGAFCSSAPPLPIVSKRGSRSRGSWAPTVQECPGE